MQPRRLTEGGPPIVGIFVGGEARRMGGMAKGLLRAPGGAEAIVERLVRIAHGVACAVVLVGRADAYAALACPSIADVPVADPGNQAGPLGGLVALLEHAGRSPALVLACDMPYVTEDLLARLASHPSSAAVLAPRNGQFWEPFFARYDSLRALPSARASLAAGERSLQKLLEDAGVGELPLTDAERAQLRDWDRPEDTA